MKDAEEYLDDIKEKYNIGTAWQVTKPYILEAIKQAQTDAWNAAIDKAAESATVVHIDLVDNTEFDYTDVLIDSDVEIKVNKDSILKLKI